MYTDVRCAQRGLSGWKTAIPLSHSESGGADPGEMKMDTVVKSRESSRVLDCSSQSPGSCDSSSVCLADDEQS